MASCWRVQLLCRWSSQFFRELLPAPAMPPQEHQLEFGMLKMI